MTARLRLVPPSAPEEAAGSPAYVWDGCDPCGDPACVYENERHPTPYCMPRMPMLSAKQAIEQRGYHVAYRAGQPNYCPGCGRSHWWVRRLTAECAFCGTAVAIAGER